MSLSPCCHDEGMLEALNSASLGAMASLLKKLDDVQLTHDSAPNIQKLREGVGSISSKMVKLSDVQDPPLTVSYWMKDARELSYDMEDWVDRFINAKADAKMDWINEISGFETRVEEVKERYDRFNLEYVLGNPKVTETVASYLPRTDKEETEHAIPLGMEGPINELLGWLKPKGDDDNKQPLKIISILGVEGVGKSTLVQEIWRKLGGEFECRAFVQAAKKPDMRMILRSILLQVHPQEPPEACQVSNLIHDIRKHLQDKRYFIIIDDLCSVSVWDAVNRAFPEDDCCSRIMTTTTIEDVALACCSYEPEHIFIMKPLSGNHSKELFIRTVYGSGKGCPQQFHDAAVDITKKCGGLPLAIICIATLLAKPGTIQQWEYVRNFLNRNLRTNSTSVEILDQVMKLCYSCLPHCLKTCLLYLSIYPENYIVLKEDLLQQWIAEGFICKTKEQDNFEVARSYFEELVSLGLIQRMDINSDKKELLYVVHPKVFGFITRKSIEENFITIIDYSQPEVALTDKIRRLSVHFGSAAYATTPESFELSHVRSLTFMGLLNCMPPLVEFKLVRVVILQIWAEDKDTSFPLTEICGLLLLRYLLVKCNITVELPNQMRCLKHLETLEINARVAAVPSDIVHLPRLLHLRLGRSVSLPAAVKTFNLVDMIPRLPRLITHFRNLRYLDAVVRELQTYNVYALAELWALIVVSLYVKKPTAGNIHFKRGAFPALKYFRYMVVGVISLKFDKEAMPNVCSLNIGFNAQRGVNYGQMLVGIQHLLNLHEIVASVGAALGTEASDRRAAESAFQNAISKHPGLVSFKVKRLDRVDGKHDPSEKNWIQDVDVLNEQDVMKKQHGARKKDLSNDQHVVQGKMPMEELKGHADIGIEQLQVHVPEKSRFLLLLLVSLTAAITYQSGLNPPVGLWLDDDYRRMASDPITSQWRQMAFYFCNSFAFVTSLLSVIILLQKRVQFYMETAMILDLFGLIGAYVAGSCLIVITSLHYAMALAGAVLMIRVGSVRLNHTDVNRRRNAKFTRKVLDVIISFRERTHEWLLIFATMTTTITFAAAFSIENDESGRLHASELDLLYIDPSRYRAFLFWNTVSFVLSTVLVLFVMASKYCRPGTPSMALPVFMAAEVCSLLGAVEAGSVPNSKTYTCIVLLVAVVMSVAILDSLSKNTADMECDPTAHAKDGSAKESDRKYVMLLAILEAAVTYQVGLSPPIGVWHGHGGRQATSNSVMQDNAFFYCNAFAFVASLVVMNVLLVLRPPYNKWLVRVLNTMVVLNMLSLLVAYAASSMRSIKTFGYISTLIIVMVVAFAIHVKRPVVSMRAKTQAAAATASQAKEELRHSPGKVSLKDRLKLNVLRDKVLEWAIEQRNSELKIFDFSQVFEATMGFSEGTKLRQGDFGPVYKGHIFDGPAVAVKKLASHSGQGFREFKNEIQLIAKLRHRNLVSLLGFCSQGEEKMLVYEYLANESLDFFIFDETRRTLLTWNMRLMIIEGIAQGLQYLHEGNLSQFIHGDIKASNVLLDSGMNAKLSDFGLARMFSSERVVGTYCYMAPEYAYQGRFTTNSDVFSFGVLVLEIVTGKRNSGFHQCGNFLNLLGHAWQLWIEGRWIELVDTSLIAECHYTPKMMTCINIALLCVQETAADRPTMSNVVKMLRSESMTLPEPKHPAYFHERVAKEETSSAELCSANDVTISSPQGR